MLRTKLSVSTVQIHLSVQIICKGAVRNGSMAFILMSLKIKGCTSWIGRLGVSIVDNACYHATVLEAILVSLAGELRPTTEFC